MKKVKKFIIDSLLKIIFSILLVWLIAALSCVLGPALFRIHWLTTESLVFSACFLAYFIIHFALYKPILSHVMAHELTHALAAILMGGKVTSIHASTTGGTTVINKSHLFISLAPYIFPLYTAVALGLFAIAADSFQLPFLGLIGFTYAFHLALTIYSLSHHQPDLKEGGVVFSLIFILAGNMIVLMLLISFLWPHALPFSQAFSETFHWAIRLAQSLYNFLIPHLNHSEGKSS